MLSNGTNISVWGNNGTFNATQGTYVYNNDPYTILFNDTLLNETIDDRSATSLPELTDVDDAVIPENLFVLYGDGNLFVAGLFSHTWLDDIGTYTHGEIDTHVDSQDNPHNVTTAQIGAVSLTENETIDGFKMFTFLPVAYGTPTNASHLVPKSYVDTFVQGLKPKDSCVAASTENLNLSDEQIIDGVLCNATNRVLVKDQTNATENGIYVVASGAWTRATDYDNDSEVSAGTFTYILPGGNENGNTQWVQFEVEPVVNLNALNFRLLPDVPLYTASSGVKKVTLDFQADLLEGGGLNLSGNSIQIAFVNWSKINTSGSLLNDLGNVEASPGDNDCLVYNATSSLWQSGECGTGSGGTGSTESITSLSFVATPQTTQAWNAMPLAITELFNTVYSRQKMNTADASYYRLYVSQSAAGYTTAVLRLQYSTNGTTWLDCDGTNLGVGAGTGLKTTTWLSIPSPCKGDYQYRIVGEGGNGATNPAWRQIVAQFKILVSGASNESNYTITGASDTNLTSVTDGQAITWSSTQSKWIPTTWGVLGEDNNWTSVVTDTIFFASTPNTPQTWTNQPLAITELFGTIYARQKKDLTYSSFYKMYVDQAGAGYSTAVLRLQYSTDRILWLDCDGTNLGINATLGFKETDWIAIPSACRGDYYLRLVGQGGNADSDPSFRMIAVQFKNLVGDTNATAWDLVGLGDTNITNPLDGEFVYWDGTQNKWRARNINLSNGSNIITTEIDFTASASATTTSVPVWTNMPLATTEFLGGTTTRTKMDLSSATEYRILVSNSVIGSAGSKLRLQCSSDEVLWENCNDTNTTLGNTLGLKVGDWLTYPNAYKGDVYLRIVGEGGDGAADPAFRLLKAQFHVISGTGGSGNTGFNETEGIYIYNSTTYKIDFNETKLNTSIDTRANGTGLIKDWNDSGFIQNWSDVITLIETLWNANYSNFSEVYAYAINDTDWNFSGYVINWSNIDNWNDSGWIINWNASELILNWSEIITSEETNWNNNYSAFLDINTTITETNTSMKEYVDDTFYLKTNPYGYYNSTSPMTETDPKWTANSSNVSRVGNCSGSFVQNSTNTSAFCSNSLTNLTVTGTNINGTGSALGLSSSVIKMQLLGISSNAFQVLTPSGGVVLDVDTGNNRTGINTITPNAKLDIQGTADITGLIVNGSNSSQTAIIKSNKNQLWIFNYLDGNIYIEATNGTGTGVVPMIFAGYGTGLADTDFYFKGPYSKAVSGRNMIITSAGLIGTAASSEKYKTDIKDYTSYDEDVIMKLRPVSFKYNDSKVSGTNNETHYGFIAEEVNKVMPDIVYKKNGTVEGIDYEQLIAPMVAKIQEQQRQIDELNKTIQMILSR